jgi:hypothetical protein
MLPFLTLWAYTDPFLSSPSPDWGTPIIKLIRSRLLLLGFASHLASTFTFSLSRSAQSTRLRLRQLAALKHLNKPRQRTARRSLFSSCRGSSRAVTLCSFVLNVFLCPLLLLVFSLLSCWSYQSGFICAPLRLLLKDLLFVHLFLVFSCAPMSAAPWLYQVSCE